MSKKRDPQVLLDTESFSAVVRIPEKIFNMLSKPSANDFDEIGQIFTNNQEIIIETKGSKGIPKEQFLVDFSKSSHTYGIFTEEMVPDDGVDGDKEGVKPIFEMIEFAKIQGSVTQRLNFQPNDDVRQMNIMQKVLNIDRLPKARFNLKDDEYEEKRLKIDEQQLKEELFDLFTHYQTMSFDEINREVDQPRSYLQAVLDQLCVKKKVRIKTMYSLKKEYLLNDDTSAKKKLKTK